MVWALGLEHLNKLTSEGLLKLDHSNIHCPHEWIQKPDINVIFRSTSLFFGLVTCKCCSAETT